MRTICVICLFFTLPAFVPSQEWDGVPSRSSIPDELLQPKRGESPHYPVDTVIGELGQGSAPAEAYSVAVSIAEGLYLGATGNQALSQINGALRQSYFSALDKIDPRSYRLGGGRQESDGAVSFMIRFLGREQGITGELFIKYVPNQVEIIEKIEQYEQDEENEEAENGEISDEIFREEILIEEKPAVVVSGGSWIFDELILEEARNHEDERKDTLQRFDFSPYERFF